jgi:hypothetical protein
MGLLAPPPVPIERSLLLLMLFYCWWASLPARARAAAVYRLLEKQAGTRLKALGWRSKRFFLHLLFVLAFTCDGIERERERERESLRATAVICLACLIDSLRLPCLLACLPATFPTKWRKKIYKKEKHFQYIIIVLRICYKNFAIGGNR